MPRHRLYFTFSLVVAALLLGAATIGIAIAAQARDWQWVLHTREALERLQAMRSGVAEAVVEQRGFLLSQDPAYLERFERGARSLRAQVDAFKALTADNPRQQAMSDALASRIEALLQELRDVTRAGRPAVGRRGMLEHGTIPRDAVETQIAAMRSEEERLLSLRNADVARARALTIAAVAGFCVLAVLLMAYMRHVVSSDARRVRELLAQRQLALDAARLGWWHLDLSSGISEFDERFREIWGVDARRLPMSAILERIVPEDRARAQEALVAATDARPRTPYHVDYRIRCASGEELWIESRGEAVVQGRGDEARVLGLVGTVNDVTARKRAEIALAELNRSLEQRVQARTRDLEEANSEMEAFAYSVSHDLRAPLRGIHGYAQALEEDFAPDLKHEARQYLQRIAASAARMDDLIQDLLAYSRLGRDEMALTPVELEAVVAESLGALRQPMEDAHAIVDVARPLPDVLAARAILLQAVQNLVANAIKFVPPGIVPRVRIHAERRAGRVRLWIDDNGIGIEPRHQERIFRVFERLHGPEAYPGTGIGLAIVRKAMERMGGTSGVESTPGAGSRFWIELPEATGKRP